MAVILGVYVALHPPVSAFLRELVGISPSCLDCGGAEPVGWSLSAVLVVGAAITTCWLLVSGTSLAQHERLPAAGLLAFALVTVPAAWIGWSGDLIDLPLLRPPSGPLMVMLPSITVLALLARRRWPTSRSTWSPGVPWSVRVGRPVLPGDLLAWVLATIAALLIAVSIGVSLQHAPAQFDELGYHGPLSILFWRDGTLEGPIERISGYVLAHPGSAELWYGLLGLIGGERIASLGQLPFAFLGAASVLSFARHLGVPRSAARIGALAFLVAPIVVMQVGFRNNDLVAAALLMATATLAAAPPGRWSRGRVALIAIGLGVMIATKLALLPAAAALGLVVVGASFVRRGRQRRAIGTTGASRPGVVLSGADARSFMMVVLLVLLVVGPWWLRNLEHFGNPIYPVDVPLIGGGVPRDAPDKDERYVPDELLWPLYPILEPHLNVSGLGTVFAVTVLPGAFMAIRRGRRWPLVIIGTLAIISLPSWWLLTRHEPRFLLGILGLCFVVVPLALVAVTGRWRLIVVSLLALSVAASATITLTGPVSELASFPDDPVELYVERWAADAVVLRLPESTPLMLDTRCPRFDERLYPHLGPSQSREVSRVACGATLDSVLAVLARDGVRAVYAVSELDSLKALDERYPETYFELVHQSTIDRDGITLVRRLYQLRDGR